VNCANTGGEGLARHSQTVLGCSGWQSLYNWLSPEVLRGEAVSKISDIYSLCVLVYELSTGTIPWAQMSADTIQENMPSQGVTLPLDQETMPSDLYQVLTRGLQADYKARDLDIHQIRDVFQRIRDKIGNESDQKQNQVKQNTTPTKPCPSRSLSSSAIQYNKNHYLRKLSNNASQRSSSQSSGDYSFVSNEAKRQFLRSQPSTPRRPSGLGGRSRTSIFYESFSLSSGLYFSGSDSSGEHPCDTSDSSSSSLSPTSGYSSYDILDQDIPQDRTVRNTSRGWGENHTRSVSVPRIHPRTTQDYVTGIKPASHRIESHTSNCNVHSATSTPNHSSTKYSGNDVQKQRRSSLTNQKEFFNLRISGGNKTNKEDRSSHFTRSKTQYPDNEKRKYGEMTRKSLCQSHPRLFSKPSSESGYGSSSPIGLTGNMQLSSRYKSSAELVSELLQRPLQINNYQNRYQNNKLNNNSDNNHVQDEENKELKVTPPSELKSVELVRNIGLNTRKVGRDECRNLSVGNNKNILCEDKYSDHSDFLDCDKSEDYEVKIEEKTRDNLTRATNKRYSIGDTEDLYCDDELDPSLENDPNMRLYTENINITMESGLLDIGDDESILSMEIPSTGPQSLASCVSVSEYGRRGDNSSGEEDTI